MPPQNEYRKKSFFYLKEVIAIISVFDFHKLLFNEYKMLNGMVKGYCIIMRKGIFFLTFMFLNSVIWLFIH